MRILYLTASLIPFTSAYIKFVSDPHDVLRRSIWAGQSSYLNITTWAEPDCQGIPNDFIAATNQNPVELTPSAVKSFSLNRTLGGVEQLDFSANIRPPALPSVATTTTLATVGPPTGASHVGPTTWATSEAAAAIASLAACHMDYQQSEMAAHSIGVAACRRKKRDLPQGQCAIWIWTADDPGKDGSPGNCHTLPNEMEADCWNIWVHG
ncbi:hypothetical protein OEA41_010287 [Lepraria neglecta]|uniref:Uncharacterized protein n=1 Tax=Lepraria neglecta TaxID=209136 RepID=A0AAD9YWA2_9LECA|nr:hypothetical protein OEA41_010287 [Lepraria neglecta]